MHREQVNQVPQGWYPDPSQPGVEKYWNGNGWTNQIRIVSTPPPVMPLGSAGQAEIGSKKRTRSWFSGLSIKKKIGLGFAGLVVLSALGNAIEDDPHVPQPVAGVADTLPMVDENTSTTLLPAPSDGFAAAPQASVPVSAETVPEPSPDVGSEMSEAEAGRVVYMYMVRSKFPLIGLALEADPNLEIVLFDLGEDMCEAGRNAASLEELMLGLLLMWNVMDATSQSLFNDDYEGLAEFSAYAMGALCPRESDRLRS